jgi:hypothetical protein
MSNKTISTAFGVKTVDRVIGCMVQRYVKTLPTPSAPNGEYWTLNPQRGYVPVASNSRALVAALSRSSFWA